MRTAPRAITLLTLFLLTTSAVTRADELPQREITAHQLAQRVDAFYNGLHSLRADFSESYRGMGIHREERGTLVLRKPARMRWNYAQPPGKLFILDGKYGWFYTPGDAQADRIAASQLDDLRSPLRFLLGHTHLEKEFDTLHLSTTSAGFELSGVPKGMQQRVAQVVLGITAEGIIQSIAITEIDGARTAFAFTDIQPNAPAPAADFVFHAPEGVPVVDALPPV
jgi:outer membrane lipoprotein carrier protein